MTIAVQSISVYAKKAYSTKAVVSAILNRTVLLNTILLVLVACLGFMYIIQINISATKGFAIRDLEKRISTSKLENEQLESKLAELQSMDNIASKVSMLGMVPVDRIDYYSSVSSSFALNE